jgi:uncharacterized membrane protein YdbT with pleckstrin-like domain
MTGDMATIEVRQSWWNYFWYLFFFWLLLIPPAVAWWKRKGLLLQIHDDRVTMRTGVLGRESKDVFIDDIRTIEVEQSFFERLVKIGELRISTAVAVSDEITIPGIPDPRGLKDLLLSRRRGGKGTND